MCASLCKGVRRLWLLSLFCGVLTALGCGGGGPTYKVVPVEGKITVDGVPMSSGSPVAFVPDASKNNTLQVVPNAMTTADGSYKLLTEGRPGAPPGWYKVTISSMGGPPMNPKYGSRDQTDLSIEVVDNPAPGRYDLKVSK